MAKPKKSPPHTPDPLVKEAEAMARKDRAGMWNEYSRGGGHTWLSERQLESRLRQAKERAKTKYLWLQEQQKLEFEQMKLFYEKRKRESGKDKNL